MAEIVGTPKMIKLLNKDIIENLIQTSGPITKPEIADKTKLSLVTVNKTVETLLKENRVKVSGVHKSTGGRCAQFFEINEKRFYFVGLYYYKNKYLGVIANSIGQIVYKQEFPVRTKAYSMVIDDTCFALDTLFKKYKTNTIRAIGIGVPGVVKNGVITSIPNIPSWEGINIAERLENHYKVKVFLENDINLAAMGIYYNKYQNTVDNLALVYFEQGIGSGLILNKELFKGSTNFAGELSYMPVHSSLTIGGKKMTCGKNFEDRITFLNDILMHDDKSEDSELRKILQKTVADALLRIICIINPEILVLKYDLLKDTDIKNIKDYMEICIGIENMPVIVKLDDVRTPGVQGVIDMCIRETTPIYSLSSKKRR